jgi:hypothetical protein
METHPMPNETQLDEKSLRRPGFRSGHLVTLADGQQWGFRRLGPLWVISDVDVEVVFDVPREQQALLEAIDAAHQGDDLMAVVRAEMRLFAFMVRQNYELPTGAISQLIRVDYREPGTDPIRRALLNISVGAEPDAHLVVEPVATAEAQPEVAPEPTPEIADAA